MILQRARPVALLSLGLDAPLVLIARFLSIVSAARAVLWTSDRVSRLACLMATSCTWLALQRFAPWPMGLCIRRQIWTSMD